MAFTCVTAGPLPASLATCNDLVVLDLHSNGLSGTLEDFAFQTQANREDLHSSLRYFDVSNNTLSGGLLQLDHTSATPDQFNMHGFYSI